MSRGQRIFLSILGVCVVGVTVVILGDVMVSQHSHRDGQFVFQQAIGGVGLGSVTVPAWNFSDYDPRLQQQKEDVLYPLPGGYSYSPDRLAMVTHFSVQ